MAAIHSDEFKRDAVRIAQAEVRADKGSGLLGAGRHGEQRHIGIFPRCKVRRQARHALSLRRCKRKPVIYSPVFGQISG